MREGAAITIEILVENARRLGKESQHVALAAGFCRGLAGVASLCVWCADERHGWTAKAFRLPRGGECQACSYTGYDCLVVVPAES